MATPCISFEERSLILLNDISKQGGIFASPTLGFVRTEKIYSEKELKKWHDTWVKDGFEGAILREPYDTYHFNGRVVGLLKYKEFFDKEVTIIGGVGGKGLEEGCVIFKVRDEFGNEFSSRPKGTRKIRKRWLRDIKLLIGKPLTIRYQELSEDNVPIFNTGIEIRDYE
jgi:DNA ligase-1